MIRKVLLVLCFTMLSFFINNFCYGQKFEWVKTADPNGNSGVSIVYDNDFSYVIGSFNDTLIIYTDTLVSFNILPDYFLAKFDLSGNINWLKHAGANYSSLGGRLTLDKDPDGNIYTIGNYSDSIRYIDSIIYTNALFPHRFTSISKIDTAGSIIWLKQFGGNISPSVANGIYISSSNDGSVFISGYFWGNLIFDNDTLYSFDENIFIAKLDSSGNYLWSTVPGGSLSAIITGIENDLNGNIYIIGHFSDTL